MSDFLKQSGTEAEPAEPNATAPHTQIRYDPDLIEQLMQDHRSLLDLYGQTRQASEAGDYARVSQRLAAFRRGLHGHLLAENVRLYLFLDRHLAADDKSGSDLIRGFRREMDGIGKLVMGFLKKYEAIAVDPELAGTFAEDFAAIGNVLVERIEKEERVLYPLYMPY